MASGPEAGRTRATGAQARKYAHLGGRLFVLSLHDISQNAG